jgi:hypothetical protein
MMSKKATKVLVRTLHRVCASACNLTAENQTQYETEEGCGIEHRRNHFAQRMTYQLIHRQLAITDPCGIGSESGTLGHKLEGCW